MQPPTLDMLLSAFRAYNATMWPLLVADYLLLLVAISLALRPREGAGRAITGFLSFLWLSTAIAFGLLRIVLVYRQYYLFLALLVLQAILFLLAALRAPLSFRLSGSVHGVIGALVVLYAAVGYPLVGTLLGRGYPELVLIGAPCPTTVLTFGLLLWTKSRVPRYLLVIPLLVALSGVMPVSIGVWEDIGLITSGLVATGMILYRDAKHREAAPGAATAQTSR